MRVAYAASLDTRDVITWSGSALQIAKCLERQGVEVDHLGPLAASFDFPLKVKTYFYRTMMKQNYDRFREPVVSRGYARQVQRKLARGSYDFVLGLGVMPVAALKCPQPIAFWADATFDAMVDFYPTWTNLAA